VKRPNPVTAVHIREYGKGFDIQTGSGGNLLGQAIAGELQGKQYFN